MPRAFVYIRVSSQEQAKHDRYSLPEQQRRLREFCEQKGYTVAALYQDVQSGKRDDRKQYQAMLAALRQKQAERVVVFLLDRFGRNTREILTRVWELQDLGVTVEASDEDISHELIRLIMAWRAGDESERIAKRVKPSLEARAALGKWNGTPAFGLTIGKDGKLAIDPADNCRAVDLAFEWYDPAGSERLSLNAICRRLKALGYKQPWGGTDWHSGTLYRLLTCRAYVGDFLRNGQEIMDNHPARIDRAVFERVQARLTLRKHNQTSVSERPDRLGAGLVYCACGYPMRYSLGVTMSQKGRHYGYWSCNRRRIVGDCQARGFSELALARVLRSRLAALRLPTPEEVVHRAAELRQPTAPEADERERIEGMIADLAKREANLLDMREGGEIDRAELLRRIGPVRTDLARAKERLRQLDGWQLGSLPALATEVRTLLTGLDLVNLTPSELAPLVAVLVERIVIEAGSVRVVWKPGVAELFGEIT